MKRREFIKSSSLKALAALAGTSLWLNACHTEEDMIGEPNWIVDGRFDRPLPIPSIVNSNASLNPALSSAELLKGAVSETLAYGNGLLGPTINATKGETINISLQNNL